MAVKKIQIRPPENDYADVLHPETDTTMVLLPDGSVLQDQLVAPLASGSATALVIDMPGITSYTHGKLFQFIASANNNGAASTLKVGTLPARPIYLEGTTNTAPNLIAGRLYTVWADNTKNCFFLKASGSGNAVAADLLAGKTATTDNGPITGTMPNNGSQNAILTITGSAKPTKVIPAGYTSGGTITAQLASSLASKIRDGETIGGVRGTLVVPIPYFAEWTRRTSSFGATSILGVAYGSGMFVAVGHEGKLATSPDGITWTQRTSSFDSSGINGIAYGNGMFVAVGYSGKLATSPDGITWTQRTSSFDSTYILGVAYGSGMFVAVGQEGKLATSPDGITWTQRISSFDSTYILEVAYGSGMFVAVGGRGGLATSTDGITWTQRTSSFDSDSAIYGIAYGNGMFVAGGFAGTLATLS